MHDAAASGGALIDPCLARPVPLTVGLCRRHAPQHESFVFALPLRLVVSCAVTTVENSKVGLYAEELSIESYATRGPTWF